MVAARLTSFSKLLITALILGLIYFGGRWVLNNTAFGENFKETVEEAKNEAANKNEETKSSDSKSTPTKNISAAVDEDGNKVLRVQLVTWGGYAPGLYFNKGAAANSRSRYFQDYGFKVDFKLNNDLDGAVDAWFGGEYDVLVQTADAFPLYTGREDMEDIQPKAFMQVDWSRGGDAIIVKRGIKTINDLKGKTVAIAAPSPAQTLLISSLEAAGLDYSDVNVIKTADNFKAAELFRSKDVDAAVVWSPDDIIATQDVPGSKILLTTNEQSHIIADIMFAKDGFINENKEMIDKFYEGWMKAVAELNEVPQNKDEAAKYLAEFNGMGIEDGKGMMSVIYLTGHGDNKNFFGIDKSYTGQTGYDLYSKMAQKFYEIEKDVKEVAPSWRSSVYTGAVNEADEVLVGARYAAEKSKVFATSSGDKTAPAISNKPISINFETAEYLLTPAAKTKIDLEFAETAKIFGNTKIRIEGNTDNVGSRENNQALSRKRANSVANYLKNEYKMDPNRFVIIGNGPDKPVKGCEQNQTEECKSKNRRTDFQLIAG